MQLFYKSCKIANNVNNFFQIMYEYCANIIEIGRKYYFEFLKIFYKLCANIGQILCKYWINIIVYRLCKYCMNIMMDLSA